MSNLKILALGAANGSIEDLFTKINGINAKHGPFDIALCVGDFFTQDADVSTLLGGNLQPPMECYIMQGDHALPEAVIDKFAKTGGELCKNVFLMSKSGLVTSPSGLRIACLGGSYDPSIYSSAEIPPGFASPFFSYHTTDRLLSNALAKTAVASSTAKNYSSLAAIASNASSSQLVDILISNVWPASVANFSAVSLPNPELVANKGAPPVDDVIRRLKPKYHFAASTHFWEREPFMWNDEQNRVTRFVGLGAFAGVPTEGKKQRWFYALSFDPSAPQPHPQNGTKNPFTEAMPSSLKRPIESVESGQNFIFGNVRQPVKRVRAVQDPNGKPPAGYKCKICESVEHFISDCPERQKPAEGYVCKLCNEPGHFVRDCPTKHAVGDTGGRKPREGYVCRACGSNGHYLDDCPIVQQQPACHHNERRGKRGHPKEIGPDECWFCLSNPSLAKHLIVSIGSECYVTLPKGQIHPTQSALTSSSPWVPGGGHVLIVPISHFPTYASIPTDLADATLAETNRYKSALRAFYAKHGCATVFWEIGRTSGRGVHAHIQVVPIPRQFESAVEAEFQAQGRRMGIAFETMDESAEGDLRAGGYLKVDLPDNRKMVHRMTDGVPFSVQFGRQVIVELLGCPERMDWKACMLPEDEDRMDAQAFKDAFAPFDPSR